MFITPIIECLKEIANIIWNTGFSERPNYELIAKYLSSSIKILNLKVDNVFDWTLIENTPISMKVEPRVTLTEERGNLLL